MLVRRWIEDRSTTTPLNGLVGGAVVAALVGVATVLVAGGPSIAAAVLTLVTRGADSRERRLPALALQIGADGVAGAAFVAVTNRLGGLGVPPDPGEALLYSVAWSGLLFVVGLAVRAGRRRGLAGGLRFLLATLAVGVLLGLWVRMTWSTWSSTSARRFCPRDGRNSRQSLRGEPPKGTRYPV